MWADVIDDVIDLAMNQLCVAQFSTTCSQFKKHENTHRGVLLLVKVTLPHECFSRFQIVQMAPNRVSNILQVCALPPP